jgi:hypothetical protein
MRSHESNVHTRAARPENGGLQADELWRAGDTVKCHAAMTV